MPSSTWRMILVVEREERRSETPSGCMLVPSLVRETHALSWAWLEPASAFGDLHPYAVGRLEVWRPRSNASDSPGNEDWRCDGFVNPRLRKTSIVVSRLALSRLRPPWRRVCGEGGRGRRCTGKGGPVERSRHVIRPNSLPALKAVARTPPSGPIACHSC